MSIKVVVTDYVEPDLEWESNLAREWGIRYEYHQLIHGAAAQLLEVTRDADVVVVNMARMTAEVIAGLEKCRLILRHGIGYDNVDIDAAARRGIIVGHYPDYCVNEVAEQAVLLMMACQRKLIEQAKIVARSAGQNQWDLQPIKPIYSLRGKTVGVVGLGRIGKTVYRMLQGFGVNFLIVDPYLEEDAKQSFGIETIPLEQALHESDVVTIHCPLNDETRHMFGYTQFEMMKPTATLINTARGGIVNLAALDTALSEGQPAMAGIDVYEKEPPPAGYPILNNPRAILTPHLSWLSEESLQSIRQKVMTDVQRFMQGQPPVNQVNP